VGIELELLLQPGAEGDQDQSCDGAGGEPLAEQPDTEEQATTGITYVITDAVAAPAPSISR
jgi:hypothetical protein